MEALEFWWQTLSMLEKIYVVVAMPSTAILLIQTIMIFFSGIGGDSSLDSDVSGMGGGEGLDLDGGMDLDFDGGLDLDGGLDMEMDLSGTQVEGPVMDTDLEFGEDAPAADDGTSSSSDFKLITTRGILGFLVVFSWSGILFSVLGVPPIPLIVLTVFLGFLALVAIAKLMQQLSRLQEVGNFDYREALGKTGKVYLTIPAGRSDSGKVTIQLDNRFGEYYAVTDDPQPIKTGADIRVIALEKDNIFLVERV